MSWAASPPAQNKSCYTTTPCVLCHHLFHTFHLLLACIVVRILTSYPLKAVLSVTSHAVTFQLEMSNIFLPGPSDPTQAALHHCSGVLIFTFHVFSSHPSISPKLSVFFSLMTQQPQGSALCLKSAALHHSVLFLYRSPVIDGSCVHVCVFNPSVSWKARELWSCAWGTNTALGGR